MNITDILDLDKKPELHVLYVVESGSFEHTCEGYTTLINLDPKFKKRFGIPLNFHIANTLGEAEDKLEGIVGSHSFVAAGFYQGLLRRDLVMREGLFDETVESRIRSLDDIRMRYAREKTNVQAFLFKDYPRDHAGFEEVRALRAGGAKRVLQIGDLGVEDFEHAITALLRAMMYKRVPRERKLTYPLELRVINNEKDLEDSLRLRYWAFGPEGMGYIRPDLHNKSGLDVGIDDLYSTHFGVFLTMADGSRVLATTLRHITKELQPSSEMLRRIVEKSGEKNLLEEISKTRQYSIPTEKSYDIQYLLDGSTHSRYGEFSKIVVPDYLPHHLLPHHFDPDQELVLRGFGLSRIITEWGIAFALHMGYNLAFIRTDPIQKALYEKYGCTEVELVGDKLRTANGRIVNNTFVTDEEANPTIIMLSDLTEDLPDRVSTSVEKFRRTLASGEYVTRISPQIQ